MASTSAKRTLDPVQVRGATSGLKRQQRELLGNVFAWIILGLGGAAMLVPFLWMVFTSLKSTAEIYVYPPRFLPDAWLWSNYLEAWTLLPFPIFFRNSAVVSVGVVLGQLFTCSLAGYSFGRLRYPGRDRLFFLYLATMMIPFAVIMIPLYVQMRWMGRFDTLTYHDWITDTTVDDGHGWGYLNETTYKSLPSLIHYLVDNVSKNGYMLLNVGPKPNGEIPDEAKALLNGIGQWLAVNGEAIYGTTAWMSYGEGPTQMTKAGYFMEDAEVHYTGQDIRFTVKDDVLYAICLGWPEGAVTIETLRSLYPSEIKRVSMLGAAGDLHWVQTPDGLMITPPAEKPCEHAIVLKIERQHPFGG